MRVWGGSGGTTWGSACGREGRGSTKNSEEPKLHHKCLNRRDLMRLLFLPRGFPTDPVRVGHGREGDGGRGDAGEHGGVHRVYSLPAGQPPEQVGLETPGLLAHGKAAATVEAAARFRNFEHHRQRHRPETPGLSAEFEHQFPHSRLGRRVQLCAEFQALFPGGPDPSSGRRRCGNYAASG